MPPAPGKTPTESTSTATFRGPGAGSAAFTTPALGRSRSRKAGSPTASFSASGRGFRSGSTSMSESSTSRAAISRSSGASPNWSACPFGGCRANLAAPSAGKITACPARPHSSSSYPPVHSPQRLRIAMRAPCSRCPTVGDSCPGVTVSASREFDPESLRKDASVSVEAPTKTAAVREVTAGGEKVAKSSGFEWLARAGFVAGGKTTNQEGALATVARQPFGKVLLILVAIGLGGYALWRLLRAFLGHGPEDSDTTFERLAAFASGIVYAGLGVVAVKILLGSGGGNSGNTPKTAAGVFGWPAGTWLVGIAGVVLIGVGLFQGYRGISKDFLKDSKTEEMSPRVRKWIEWIGTFGHLARMVVFGLVGVFLIKAAIDYNPSQAVGLDGALAKLANASYGPFLLGIVAAGLIAFGIYSLSDARYRRL